MLRWYFTETEAHINLVHDYGVEVEPHHFVQIVVSWLHYENVQYL